MNGKLGCLQSDDEVHYLYTKKLMKNIKLTKYLNKNLNLNRLALQLKVSNAFIP